MCPEPRASSRSIRRLSSGKHQLELRPWQVHERANDFQSFVFQCKCTGGRLHVTVFSKSGYLFYYWARPPWSFRLGTRGKNSFVFPVKPLSSEKLVDVSLK